MLASSAQCHAGHPSPSTSCPSQPRVVLLFSRLAHHAAYHSSICCAISWKTSQGSLSEVRTWVSKRSTGVYKQSGYLQSSQPLAIPQLKHEMHQVTEQAANTPETMSGQVADVGTQLAKEQGARQAAELQLKALEACWTHCSRSSCSYRLCSFILCSLLGNNHCIPWQLQLMIGLMMVGSKHT